MILDFPSRYPEYLIAAMIIILAPGPSVLFIIARAIAWGRATAIASVAGNATASELAFIGVQLLGGLYLIYLGLDAIKHSRIHADDMVNQGDVKPSNIRSIKDGFWVGALNPKGLVFFAAILPQFVDKGSEQVTEQLVIMGATFAILAFFSDGTWGLIAGTVRQWLATSPQRLVLMRRIGGLVMITLGIFTLTSAI